MIAEVKDQSGTNTLKQISGAIPTGNPVGSLLSTYKKIQPRNYLYCDGSTFNASQYPALYLYLGTNVLPDYRECVMVGAEENTTDTIATHDVYSQGEFKDDQMQDHVHGLTQDYRAGGQGGVALGTTTKGMAAGTYYSQLVAAGYRAGTTTHGKQKAVYVYIKAVDGVDISDEDTFLDTVKNFVEEKNSYSTTETLTGGKWIDGKPIYRKVIDCGGLPNSSTKTVAHNITNIDKVIKIYGVTISSSDTFPLPYATPTGIGNCILLSYNSTSINIRTGVNRTGYTNTYVTLEYTKTTD